MVAAPTGSRGAQISRSRNRYRHAVHTHPRTKRAQPDGRVRSGWLTVSVLSLVAFGVAGSALVSHYAERWREADMRKWDSWPATQGSPVDTRIVEQPLTKSSFRWNRGKWHAGECQVAYSVGGRRYSLWVEARSSANLQELSGDMRTCPIRSYDVHYDPQEPSDAHAFVPGAAHMIYR